VIAMSAPRSFLLVALLAGAPAGAANENADVDCANLKLVAPAPAAAQRHDYRFTGSCRLFVRTTLATRDIRTFVVEARATWDPRSRRFTETIRVPGGFQWNGRTVGGTIQSEFACNDDPLATRAACNGFRHRNDTSLEALSNPYKQQGRPLLVGPRRTH
jgi:hypothetical protein